MNQPLAYDPYISAEQAQALGVKRVTLDELLRESDFVTINCPLTEGTRDLLGFDQLALMRSDAYLINTARGGIVNEAALVEALESRTIAGAAIDVFATEPAGADHPLAQLDNVILAPHCIGWTDELFRDIGRTACRIVVTLSRGEIPPGIVNRDVLERPGFARKLRMSNRDDR